MFGKNQPKSPCEECEKSIDGSFCLERCAKASRYCIELERIWLKGVIKNGI